MLHYCRLESLERNKHSNLLGPFRSCEENEFTIAPSISWVNIWKKITTVLGTDLSRANVIKQYYGNLLPFDSYYGGNLAS
jgi:hypothetical protein